MSFAVKRGFRYFLCYQNVSQGSSDGYGHALVFAVGHEIGDGHGFCPANCPSLACPATGAGRIRFSCHCFAWIVVVCDRWIGLACPGRQRACGWKFQERRDCHYRT